jgi:hypothetical protein
VKRSLFFATILVACVPERPGTVIVHVGTDLPDGSADQLVLEARSAGLVSRPEPIAWEDGASFGVLQPGGDDVELTVSLLSRGQTIVSATRTIERFEPGITLHVWLFLTSSCEQRLGLTCTRGQVCGRCGCESSTLEPTHDGAPPWFEACPVIEDPPVIALPDAGVADVAMPPNDQPDAGSHPDAMPEVPVGCPASSAANRSYVAGTEREITFGWDGAFSLPAPTTLEAWVRFKGAPDHRSTTLFAGDGIPNDWKLSIEGQVPRLSFEYEAENPNIQFQLHCGMPWPEDQWTHVALQIGKTSDERVAKVQLFVGGTPCSAPAEVAAWPAASMELYSPSIDTTASLKLDGVHLRVGAPYAGAFVPATVPSPEIATLGLWQMDEEDRSREARDAMCNHHGQVDMHSFADDFPR